jgi:hypothetical protein
LEQETLIGPSLVEEIVLGSLGLLLQKELGRILAKLGKESVDVGRKIIVSRREECAVATTGVIMWGLRSGDRGMMVIVVRAGAETERECEKHVDF